MGSSGWLEPRGPRGHLRGQRGSPRPRKESPRWLGRNQDGLSQPSPGPGRRLHPGARQPHDFCLVVNPSLHQTGSLSPRVRAGVPSGPSPPQVRTAVTCPARAGSPVALAGSRAERGRGRSRGGLEPQRPDLAFVLESQVWLQEVGRGAGRGEASPRQLEGAQSLFFMPLVPPVPPREDLREPRDFWRDRKASGVHPEGLPAGFPPRTDLGSSALLLTGQGHARHQRPRRVNGIPPRITQLPLQTTVNLGSRV